MMSCLKNETPPERIKERVKRNVRSRIHQNGLKTVIIKPRSGVSEGSVEGQQPVHPQFQLHGGFHVAAFSNESWDPSELRG